MTSMCPRATAGRPGLRERKKVQTRQAIRKAAYRLFAEDGYDATPVDRIAAEADVSPSTVFRYFPTKEDIVLTDEYDDGMLDALRNRPAGEPPLDALRAVMHETLALVLADPDECAELVQRQILVRDVPAIRSRSHESMTDTGRMLGAVIADRAGRPADDLEIRVFTAALFGSLHETTMYWAENDLPNDALLPLMDRAFDVLAAGLHL